MTETQFLDQCARARRRIRKAEEDLITVIYGNYCAGMQIEVSRIPKLFEVARKDYRGGMSDNQMGEAMVRFIEMGMGRDDALERETRSLEMMREDNKHA